MWLVWRRGKYVPGHEWVLLVRSVEGEVAFKTEAELHAAGVPVSVGIWLNVTEVAESENGYAADTICPEVKDSTAGIVAIDYFVGKHFAHIIANNWRRLE